MSMNMIFGLLVFLLSTYEARAQLAKGDTVLYLIYDAKEHQKIIGLNLSPTTKKYQGSIYYYLKGSFYLYDGYPLDFQLLSHTVPDTVKISALKGKRTATVNQLDEFVRENYRNNLAASYFDHLKQIYIVENSPRKGYVTITRVRVTSVIEDVLIEGDSLR